MRLVIKNPETEIQKATSTEFYVDQQKIIEYLKNNALKSVGKTFKLPNGPTIDFSGHSMLSVAMRTLCSFAIIPFLEWASKATGVELPPRIRHSNVIEYAITCYFMMTGTVIEDLEVTLQSSSYLDDMKQLEFVSANKDEFKLPFLLGSPLPKENPGSSYGKNDIP